MATTRRLGVHCGLPSLGARRTVTSRERPSIKTGTSGERSSSDAYSESRSHFFRSDNSDYENIATQVDGGAVDRA